MRDIKFVARGRPHWEEWKLGDSILACSVLERFQRVRLHVENISTQGNQLLNQLSKTIFDDKYEFEMVPEVYGTYEIISPDQFYLENNLQTITPNKNILFPVEREKPYITTQYRSKHGARSVNQNKIKEYTKEYGTLDLSNTKDERMPLTKIFNLVNNADKHVGAASGISWVSMSTRTPTVILMPGSFRRDGWDYALECMYRSPVVKIVDV